MKNKALQLFLLLGLTVGITGLAQAQTGLPYQANIPFDFTVREKLFKAGEYSISFGIVTSIQTSFLIRSADGKKSALVANSIPKRVLNHTGNSRIVFDKDGDNYTLAEVKTPRASIELYKVNKKQKSARITGVEIAMSLK